MGDRQGERETVGAHEQVGFHNEEAAKPIEEFLPTRKEGNDRLFQVSDNRIIRMFRKFSERSGFKIRPKLLRR